MALLSKCELIIENNAPVLREKDILSEKDVDSLLAAESTLPFNSCTSTKKIWKIHSDTYWKLVSRC